MEYTIKVGSAVATVRNLGGELISYVKDGKEYCWTGDEKYWFRRSPALFPFVGALKDGKTIFEDTESYMPDKHGFLRDSELETVEITDTRAVFELRETQNTLAVYPYKFSFKMIHDVKEDGFDTTYCVTNTDSKPIKFCVGAHPAFSLDSIEDYKLVFEKEEDCALGYFDANSYYSDSYELENRLVGKEWELKYSDFDNDAVVFKNIKSRVVSIVEKATNKVHMSFDYNGFSEFVIWTAPKKNAPYLCLEPWNGLPALVTDTGRFEDKPYCKILKPGESYSVGYKVKI